MRLFALFSTLALSCCVSRDKESTTAIYYQPGTQPPSKSELQMTLGQEPLIKTLVTATNNPTDALEVTIPESFILQSFARLSPQRVSGKYQDGVSLFFDKSSMGGKGKIVERIYYTHAINLSLPWDYTALSVLFPQGTESIQYTESTKQGQAGKVGKAALPAALLGIREYDTIENKLVEKRYEGVRKIRNIPVKDGVVIVGYDIFYPSDLSQEEKLSFHNKLAAFFDACKVLPRSKLLLTNDFAMEFFPIDRR